MNYLQKSQNRLNCFKVPHDMKKLNNFKYHLICRSIKERAESVSKKIGEKLTPEIKRSLDNALTMEEVEELVSLQNTISYTIF